MMTRPVVNFFQVASLVMLLVAAALLAAVTTMHFAIHGAEVQVPALKGMTVAEARSQTSGMGLNLEVDNRYYSGDVAAGHILSQSPAAGTVVRREWRVRSSPARSFHPGAMANNGKEIRKNISTRLQEGFEYFSRGAWKENNTSSYCQGGFSWVNRPAFWKLNGKRLHGALLQNVSMIGMMFIRNFLIRK